MFLDLSKAFDILSHEILLRKLDKYGIRGVANDWFKRYLNKRKLRCKCMFDGHDEYSENYPVDFGAPQGSVLGPLLFLIFTNNLYMHLENCGCILFADDTTIYMSHNNLTYINHCLENDLSIAYNWFKANLLTLNPNKTVAMCFINKNLIGKIISIKLADAALPFVKDTKFLGIWLDENLNWNAHSLKLVNKLKCNIHLLTNHRNFLDSYTLKLIYLAQIQSHLNYGLILWGNMASGETLNKIRKIQDKCLKLLLPSSEVSQTYKDLKLLDLTELINLENKKLGYKIHHKLLPSKMQDIINSDPKNKSLNKKHRYNTWNKNVPNLPRAKSVIYHHSFLYCGLKALQTLPAVLLQAPNIKNFTKHCKNTIIPRSNNL